MTKRHVQPVRCWLVIGLLVAVSAAGSAQEQKPAAGAAKVTYDDDVKMIFREHCFTCHNQNQTKGGLALDSFPKVMEGGSSGQLIFPGV